MCTGTPKQKPKAAGDKLADSVEKLSVADAPKIKSKNFNVVEEYRKSGMKRMANFVVIGESYLSLQGFGLCLTHERPC